MIELESIRIRTSALGGGVQLDSPRRRKNFTVIVVQQFTLTQVYENSSQLHMERRVGPDLNRYREPHIAKQHAFTELIRPLSRVMFHAALILA